MYSWIFPVSQFISCVRYPASDRIQLEYIMNTLRAFPFLSTKQLLLHYYQISYSHLLSAATGFMAKGKGKSNAVARASRDRSDSVPAGADSIMERTRGYQMEMFQESLRRNIIVAVQKNISILPL